MMAETERDHRCQNIVRNRMVWSSKTRSEGCYRKTFWALDRLAEDRQPFSRGIWNANVVLMLGHGEEMDGT